MKKAVIPVAGLGKRLWPVTKIIPKELLPIGTTPSLHLVLEECRQSGLKEIHLVVSPGKQFFLNHLHDFFPELDFHFIEQKEPLGLGHAVGLAEKAIGDEPFLVLLPDDLVEHTQPATLQLIEIFGKTKKPVNAAKRIAKEESLSYGIYDIASSDGKLHLAKKVVEKPHPEEAPSNIAVFGRYLFTPEIFSILKNTKPGRNREIQLADAMDALAKEGNLYAYEFEGNHFDIGNPLGFLRANLHFGKKKYGNRID